MGQVGDDPAVETTEESEEVAEEASLNTNVESEKGIATEENE